MEHYGRFAHCRASSQHDELPASPAARKGIEALQARGNPCASPGLYGLLSPFEVVESRPHGIR